MSSFFATLLSASGAAQNAVFGELFLVEPRAKADPNGRSAPDPVRLAQTIAGIWSDPHAEVTPQNRTGHPAREGQIFHGDKPVMDFETSALSYTLVQGDLVTRQLSGMRYEVGDASDDGFSRTALSLTSVRGRR